ncbi:MAG: hypothetical protein MZV63_45755 [Marinilabiliales bacterium]|nr:hypothetical protein [Marinilabiliales bacterium]
MACSSAQCEQVGRRGRGLHSADRRVAHIHGWTGGSDGRPHFDIADHFTVRRKDQADVLGRVEIRGDPFGTDRNRVGDLILMDDRLRPAVEQLRVASSTSSRTAPRTVKPSGRTTSRRS